MRSQFSGKPPIKVSIHSTAPLMAVKFWQKGDVICFIGSVDADHQNHNWEDLALTSDGGYATGGTQEKTHSTEREI